MGGLEESVYSCYLVDKGQTETEGVERGSRRLGEVGSVFERVDVIEILDPAGEGHDWAASAATGNTPPESHCQK